ncbi:EAL domain-containing protein [Rhodanobacter sp. AS-Z3]|uniref:bifunctional diguanylate cyclase/phosphodiesterase n=1 Tax=Rhodanobacter sp. AS-Z3 TaxID=3031330 RepID=UPI00247A6681|nr:EAL domain-containing protein [Rhodanobacter sp. AS-Z3]WEN16579.1 EAL domain-containing protein [Rhodanobacter sp. AS-Z3]
MSDSRYRSMFEGAEDGILLVNANTGQIEDVNPSLTRLLGYSQAELLGTALWDLGSPTGQAERHAVFVQLQSSRHIRCENFPLTSRDGTPVDVEFVGSISDSDGVKIAQCNLRDIGKRKAAEAESARHARLDAALSETNRAIVHRIPEEELFPLVCRTAVQLGGMKMAWIGWLEPDTLAVQPVASFGDDTGYVSAIHASSDGSSPFGRGPIGTAIRETRIYWCQDVLADPTTAPWRAHAALAGLVSVAALPLYRDSVIVGVFILYSDRVAAFDEATRNLLLDMATDISFALDNFSRESQRRQANERVVLQNAVLKTQQEASPDAILVVDGNGQITSCNQHFLDLWQLPPELAGEGPSAPVFQAITEKLENPEVFAARVHYLNEHRDEASHAEMSLKDGRKVDRYSAACNGSNGLHYGRVLYFRDITERSNAEQSLQRSERRYRRLIENSPDIVYRYSRSKGGIYYSARVTAILGYSVEHMLAHPMLWSTSIHPEDAAGITLAFQTYQETGVPFQIEYRIIDAAGNWHWFYDRAIDSRVEDGEFIVEGLAMDITERRLEQIRLTHLTRVHAVLSGINSLIVRVADCDELFRESCRIAVEAAGFHMAMVAMIDHQTGTVVPVASAGKSDDLLAEVRANLALDQATSTTMVSRAIRERGPIVSNNSLNDPQLSLGHRYAEEGVRSVVVLPLMAVGETHGVLALYSKHIDSFHQEELTLLQEVAANIALAIDHVNQQKRLSYLSYYDVLTGLANRSLFLERLAQYIRSAATRRHRLAIGLIDLERFKNINDSLGRGAGDSLLKQVAEWLSINVGDASLVARIDADHFAVVMPEVRLHHELSALVENTIEALQNTPFHLNDAVLLITAKVGMAVYPHDGSTVDILFRNAEAALKQAKASGDSYLFYRKRMTERVASKLSLENQLRSALDHGEFVLYYQPKVNIANSKVIGAEALIRWNNPRSGLMLPDQFIPVLEETGLIKEVGRWALHQAAEDYLGWLDSGRAGVRIAVNVSPLQLRHRNFIDDLEKVVARDERMNQGLELEITESLIMADVKHSVATLQAIRDMGVSIAIDDFGTGFSSLSYLARLPLDVLKIDRSFVVDMTAGPEGLSLVATIINLAHSLRLKVVAEGVETNEQLRLLRVLGCDEMQGYFFSKPIPRESFETLFLEPASGRRLS